ncbi:MAG: hypothetical protein WBD02_08705 [Acidimicrobiia bacterium]
MSVQRPLRELAGFRSGDKANLVNVALFADEDVLFEALCEAVTPESVAHHLAIGADVVHCHRAENVLGLNIVIHNALGGGGPATLFGDNLGKSFASRLLDMEIAVPDTYATAARPRADVSWAKEILARVPQS